MKVETEQLFKILMKRSISEGLFKTLISIHEENGTIKWLCDNLDAKKDEVIKTLHDELFIPGMTNEVAFQAVSWLQLEAEKSEHTLVSLIRSCVLAAAIYYTNVPEETRNALESGGLAT